MHIKVGSDNDAINLSKIINDGDWMVLYYAEWCGHCNDMKPEWQKVVNNFKNKKTNSNKINIAEIESKHIESLPNKPSIEGYPSIKMYNNGKEVANFENAERIASKIQEFANRNSTKEKTGSLSKNNMEFKLSNTMKKHNSIITNHNIPNMENLLMNISTKMNNESRKKTINSIKNEKPEAPKIRVMDLPCTSIRYAKACKRNPKCMYDGSILKCVDKPIIKSINNKLMSIKSASKTKSKSGIKTSKPISIFSKKPTTMTIRKPSKKPTTMTSMTSRKSSKKPSTMSSSKSSKSLNSKKTKTYNVRKTTKSV